MHLSFPYWAGPEDSGSEAYLLLESYPYTVIWYWEFHSEKFLKKKSMFNFLDWLLLLKLARKIIYFPNEILTTCKLLQPAHKIVIIYNDHNKRLKKGLHPVLSDLIPEKNMFNITDWLLLLKLAKKIIYEILFRSRLENVCSS